MNTNKVMISCVRFSNNFMSKRWFAKKPPPPPQIHPGYMKIKAKYRHFQKEDGVPIHLKGGPMDKVLYYSTIAGCGIGLIWMGYEHYHNMFPKNKD